MIEFWIAALALGLVAAAVVLVPVLRSWARGENTRSGSTLGMAIAIALAVPIAALILYSRWTTWDWSGDAARAAQAESEEVHAMDEAVQDLVARLQREPENVDGWAMLGRTYMSMGRFADAAGAYRQALDVAGGEPVELMANFAEAQALSDPQGLQGGSGQMFERILELDPDNPKGLWYGGIYAFENRRFEESEARLSKLMTMNPPETLIPLIEERIAEARAHIGVDPAIFAGAEPAGVEPAGVEPAGAEPAAEQSQAMSASEPNATPAPAVADGEAIPIQVSIDPAVGGGLPGGAPLFIIARNPAGGPPLAVIRRTAGELPLALALRDENAMMQGMTILDQPELELVARVALSGSPAAQPGDLFGEITYQRGGGPVQIRIDRVVE